MAKPSNRANARAFQSKTIVGDAAISTQPLTTPQAAAVSIGDSLINLVAGMGTSRDKRSQTTRNFSLKLTRMDLDNAWEDSWLARRVVMAPAEDCTREWRTFEVGSTGGTADNIVKLLVAEEKRLRVQENWRLNTQWGRLYGGSILIMGIRNQADLSQPLDPTTVRKGDLQYIQVLDRWRITASPELVTDLADPHFGKPMYYSIADTGLRVHYTRVIRAGGAELPYFRWRANAMWDQSVLQVVMDALLNVEGTSQQIASLIYEANVDVIKREGLSDDLASDSDTERLFRRYALAATMKANNRMLLLDGAEDYQRQSLNFGGLDAIGMMYRTEFCGAADIPMTRLYGQSAAGLNATGDGDLRNYYDMLRAWQKNHESPKLDRFDEVFVRSTLGNIPADLTYEWNALWQISDAEQATMNFQQAQADNVYLAAGVLTEGLMARTLRARGTYPEMTDDDVDMAEELGQANQERALDPPPPPVPTDPGARPTVDPNGTSVPSQTKAGRNAKRAAAK